MTLLLEAMSKRRQRPEVTLVMASLPDIHELLDHLASRLSWNEASMLRLWSAGEETLATLVIQEDEIEGSDSPRLIGVERTQDMILELEFVATTEKASVYVTRRPPPCTRRANVVSSLIPPEFMKAITASPETALPVAPR